MLKNLRRNKNLIIYILGGIVIFYALYYVYKVYRQKKIDESLDLEKINDTYIRQIRIDAIRVADFIDTLPDTTFLDAFFDLASWNEEKDAMDIIVDYVLKGDFNLLSEDYRIVTLGRYLQMDIEQLFSESQSKRYYEAIQTYNQPYQDGEWLNDQGEPMTELEIHNAGLDNIQDDLDNMEQFPDAGIEVETGLQRVFKWVKKLFGG